MLFLVSFLLNFWIRVMNESAASSNLLIKSSFSLMSDLNGGWKVYGVHLFQFVYNFSEFS